MDIIDRDDDFAPIKTPLQKFQADFAEVIAEMRGAADWSGFAESLYVQSHTRIWSDKQKAAATSMAAKLKAKREQVAQPAASVDLAPVWDMFNNALASGYKRPVYRAEGVKITKAAMTGRNPGALYVKRIEDDQYLGKVVNGEYFGNDAGREPLLAIAANPLEAAIRYGQRTGTCACCGRTLTNHASIEIGIGPICRERWGL